MKTLRLIKFVPSKGLASRYWEENGFRRNDELSISSLTPTQQYIVSAAMAWAVAQLPEGFTELESVELKRVGDVVVTWTEATEEVPAEPLTYSPAFVASIVGNGSLGQQAIEISSVPGAETDGMATLWDSLAQ